MTRIMQIYTDFILSARIGAVRAISVILKIWCGAIFQSNGAVSQISGNYPKTSATLPKLWQKSPNVDSL
jgi:hypothetical protein